MNKVDLVGVKRHLHEIQKTCPAKKRNVPESVAEKFALAEEVLSGLDKAFTPVVVDARADTSVRELKFQVDAAQTKESELKDEVDR